jgi:hypothetical protein
MFPPDKSLMVTLYAAHLEKFESELYSEYKWQKLLAGTWQSFGLEIRRKIYIGNDDIGSLFYLLITSWAP